MNAYITTGLTISQILMSANQMSVISMQCVLTQLVAIFVLASLDMRAMDTTAQVGVAAAERCRVINPYYSIFRCG